MMPSSAMNTTTFQGGFYRADDLLREAIAKRDQALRMMAECDRVIAQQSRIYADERGLTVKPNLDQLRRELFRT